MPALQQERIRGLRQIVPVALCLLLPLASYATDPNRNLAVAKPATAAHVKEQRVALVIGNSNYKSAPLKNPVNDAADIAKALQGLGFQVTLRQNQSRESMAQAIRAFGNKLKRGGTGLFYYAGHGMQVKGKNYLIPVDADIQAEDEVPYRGIDANELLAKMETARNRVNIVILDACRNNPFARSFRSSTQGLAQMDAPVGTLVAFATAPGSVAADGTGRNGLYTQHLLASLNQPGLKIEDVFKRVRVGVRRGSRGKQIPWENTSLEGDFYFKPGKPGEAPTQVAALAPTLAPEPGREAAGETWTEPTTGMEFVWIPKGCYAMGSPPSESGRYSDREHKHQVCVDGYWLGKYEVTNAQYRMFKPSHDSGQYEGHSLNGDGQPVVMVSWYDAMEFAQWLSQKSGKTFMLPTEAEWEYAARAGTKTSRYWGDDDSGLCRHANLADRTAKVAFKGKIIAAWADDGCDDGYRVTAPVGRFTPNSYGLHDILGNAEEWTASSFDQAYSGGEKRAAHAGEDGDRVRRGGSWSVFSRYVRAANRNSHGPGTRAMGTGFRLAREP